MDNNKQQRDWYNTPARKTIRLTFRVSAEGKVSLLSAERLNMICPPVVGDKPEKGKHGGFWMELLNDNNELLFHRTLASPALNSVEVHSPDGKITRVFGGGAERVFEVLVPDDESAAYISLVGEEPDEKKRRSKANTGSNELARFEIPKGKEGGKQ